MRYPGAKTKMTSTLLDYIPSDVDTVIEPFAGTAAVSVALAKRQKLRTLRINDLDQGMASLWRAIFFAPELLIPRIESYEPRAEDFYRFKDEQITGDFVEDGFRKLVLQQISYSGLGAMAGSPIGGRNQTGKYKVDCRWRPKRLVKWVNDLNDIFDGTVVDVTGESWERVVGAPGFAYIDPPYFRQGPGLYMHGDLDHEALAGTLKRRDDWLLSYDDCPEVRRLYSWAKVIEFPVTSHLHHKKIRDLIILPG